MRLTEKEHVLVGQESVIQVDVERDEISIVLR